MSPKILEAIKETPSMVFTDPKVTIEAILAELREANKDEPIDLGTAKGRKAIRSRALRISNLKVSIDDAGKKLTEDWRKRTSEVNEIRADAKAKLDALRDEIRKPADDWERQEEARIAEHRATMERITELSQISIEDTSEQVQMRMDKIREIDVSKTGMQEFSDIAMDRVSGALTTMQDALDRILINERQAAELAELRRLEEERRADEERANAERAAAERAAEEEREREKREAEAAAQKKIDDERRERAIAEAAAAAAEEARKEAEAKLEWELAEAARKAEEKAAEEAAERARQEEAEAAKARDKKHREKIHGEIVEALVAGAGLDQSQAEQVIRTIADGEIPHLLIAY